MIYNELKDFPKDFLWGASTSAYQVEGAYLEDGKSKSIIDTYEHPQAYADFKVASDFYHKYKEDIKLFAEMGLKSFRFSVAWTRIIPNGVGKVNQAGVDFYGDVIDECLKYGIEPILTMYHFDLPAVLEEKGGWSNRDTIDAFLAYAQVLFDNYGDRVKYWLTINEQNTMILHPGAIGLPPDGKVPTKKEMFQQNHILLLAQAKAIKLFHSLNLPGKIGPAINLTAMYQATANPEDAIAAHNWETIRGWSFLDVVARGHYNYLFKSYLESRDLLPNLQTGDDEILANTNPDFIAINYYSTATIAESKGDGNDVSARAGDQQIMLGEEGVYRAAENKYLATTDYGWIIDPTGLRLTLRRLYDRYELPIMITENGYGGNDQLDENLEVHDAKRIDYLEQHVKAMQLAITDGVDLFGYNPWSAIDLVSTHQGYGKRYGFIYVDRDEDNLKELKRFKKDSFYWYQKLIKNNDL